MLNNFEKALVRFSLLLVSLFLISIIHYPERDYCKEIRMELAYIVFNPFDQTVTFHCKEKEDG